MKKPIFQIEPKSNGVLVTISGDLNVRFHKELCLGFSSIPANSVVMISLVEVSSIDLFFSQILYSFSRKTREEGYQISLVSEMETSERELLMKGGLENLYNIHIEPKGI